MLQKEWKLELVDAETGNVLAEHKLTHDFYASGHIVKVQPDLSHAIIGDH